MIYLNNIYPGINATCNSCCVATYFNGRIHWRLQLKQHQKEAKSRGFAEGMGAKKTNPQLFVAG